MNEHIERAAKAIMELKYTPYRGIFIPPAYREIARAALGSIQITPMMLARAWEVCNKNRDVRLQLATGPAFKEAMQAMLDELVK